MVMQKRNQKLSHMKGLAQGGTQVIGTAFLSPVLQNALMAH